MNEAILNDKLNKINTKQWIILIIMAIVIFFVYWTTIEAKSLIDRAEFDLERLRYYGHLQYKYGSNNYIPVEEILNKSTEQLWAGNIK